MNGHNKLFCCMGYAIDKINHFKKRHIAILTSLLIYGWPIIVNGLGYPLMWFDVITRFQAALIPAASLLLALTLSYHKKGKGLCIVISMIYCSLKAFWLVAKTLEMLEDYTIIDALKYNGHFCAVLLSYILLALIAGRHLWIDKNYQALLNVKKLKGFQQIKNSIIGKICTKIVCGVQKIMGKLGSMFLKITGEYRKWILGLCFLPFLYYYWFIEYFFLQPESDVEQIIQHLKISSVPVAVLLVSLFLYKPCQIINRFGVILSSMACIGASAYGMFQYFYYYSNHPISFFEKEDPLKTYHQIQAFLLSFNAWVILLNLIIFSIGVCVIVKIYNSYRIADKTKSFKKTTHFGSAQFLDLKGIKKINHKQGIPIGAIPKLRNLRDIRRVIESIKKEGGNELLRIKTSHTTLVAPSRTGKGVGIVIPVLLEYQGPVFVTDVKGENYPIVNRARALKNRKVIAFDPFGITESPKVKINPLKFLDPKSINLVDDSQTLANLICPISPRDGSNSHHFQSQAAAVIQCLLLYVVCTEEVEEKNRNLSYVYDLLCLPLKDLNDLLTKIGSNTDIAFGSAARLANSIMGAHPEERSGILSSARVEIRFIDTYQVREATSGSDFLLSEITQGKTDLFVCIPLEKLSTQHRLLRLLTGIVFIEMQKARGKIGKDNLLMVLDEMPALGHMKQIEEILVYGGGFGISLLVVSQTIEFLQSVYPHTWKTFFSNQLSVFFGCSDPMTSKFVAEKLGKKTIVVGSVNESFGDQKREMEFSKTTSLQSSQSASETGRELLMADEIERLGERVVLAFDRGEFPIICHRIDYRERSEWKNLWDKNPLHISRETHDSMSFNEYFKKALEIITG